MKSLPHLFKNNKKWAARVRAASPEFFSKLAAQQTPEYLWIGCSDSRVPANEITGLLPGELFVHRNVANLVMHTDMNCLSVLQYAVDVLKIKHVIVCGHYGCGGIKTALDHGCHGLIDNWLLHVRDIYNRKQNEFQNCRNETETVNRLCELNVIEQVKNVGNTTVVQKAWKRGRILTVHGWIYDISNGLLKDLKTCVSSYDELKILRGA